MTDPLIRIAAALIEDDQGRVLLVRKRGTKSFMQAGGKIEPGETPFEALRRELDEEIGFTLAAADATYLGRCHAAAANEPGRQVEAELFRIRVPTREFIGAAELDAVLWVAPAEALALDLAPLTRDHVLPRAGGAKACRTSL